MVRVIEGLAEDWHRLDERIDHLSDEITALARQDAGCERLVSVPGIGPTISSATVAAIGNGDALSKGRDSAAWLGLVPKQISTGDRTVLGKISKQSNRYLRVLFVQAAWVVLVHSDPSAGRTVQQPLEMKAGQLIISMFPNMGCKSRHRTRIAGFQFGKRLKITLCRGIFVLFALEGLKSTQSFRPTPQNKVTDRSAPEISHPRRERRTDTYAGAELFVSSFQSRRNIYGIAIGCVVEEATATEIADNRRPCMNTNTCDSQSDALFVPALAK